MTVKVFDELKIKEKENRKLIILQIAEEILHENCIEDVTIRNVALKAGLSTGAIYMYFASKEELLLSMLIKNLKTLHSELETLKEIDDPAKVLKAMALAYRNYFINYGKYIDIFRHLTDKEGPEAIGQDHKEELHNTVGSILKFIEEMAAGEEIKKYTGGIPPGRLVPMVWSIVQGVSQVTLSTTSGKAFGFDFDQVIDDFIDLVFLKPKKI
ncbi:MAG: TetR/AcrR family transcriptional regulator [Smithella sp.]|nr:TetR/AcrR family transcriptional regulator [Smithella sp.]